MTSTLKMDQILWNKVSVLVDNCCARIVHTKDEPKKEYPSESRNVAIFEWTNTEVFKPAK